MLEDERTCEDKRWASRMEEPDGDVTSRSSMAVGGRTQQDDEDSWRAAEGEQEEGADGAELGEVAGVLQSSIAQEFNGRSLQDPMDHSQPASCPQPLAAILPCLLLLQDQLTDDIRPSLSSLPPPALPRLVELGGAKVRKEEPSVAVLAREEPRGNVQGNDLME